MLTDWLAKHLRSPEQSRGERDFRPTAGLPVLGSAVENVRFPTRVPFVCKGTNFF